MIAGKVPPPGVVTKEEMSAKTTFQRSAKGSVSITECSVDAKYITLENHGRKVIIEWFRIHIILQIIWYPAMHTIVGYLSDYRGYILLISINLPYLCITIIHNNIIFQYYCYLFSTPIMFTRHLLYIYFCKHWYWFRLLQHPLYCLLYRVIVPYLLISFICLLSQLF